MGIIAWIVLGAIAGFITNLLMGGGEGVIATVLLGIIGAVVGGFLIGTVLKSRGCDRDQYLEHRRRGDRRGRRGRRLSAHHGSKDDRLISQLSSGHATLSQRPACAA